MSTEVAAIFCRWREILQNHTGARTVTADAPDHYGRAMDYNAKQMKRFIL
jgi:hypothetical protein